MENKKGMLTAALVIGLIGGVLAAIGGIVCGAIAFGAADVVNDVFPWISAGLIYATGALAMVGGVVSVVGAALALKGGIVPPIIMLAGAVLILGTALFITGIIGWIAGVLMLTAAILGFVGRNAHTC